jgi:putative transcriptional regulator
MLYIKGYPMSPAGNASNLSNRVRELREGAGLTQEALGKAVGLTRQSIIAIEKGRFTPSIHTALMLASALNKRVEEIFWLEEPAGKGERR